METKQFGWLLACLALAWSVFQLAVAEWILLDSIAIRSIHLAFALSLTFLMFGTRWKLLDFALALLGASAALYLIFDYESIALRQGIPNFRDVAVGVVLLLILLEAARRSLGPALPIIALVFIISSLFASHLPPILASRDVSIARLMSKLTLSTEGVYGIPLRVSSETVFLFVLFGALLERAGGGQYFVDLAYSLLGRYRGGPAKAAVLASGLMGTVSGSSVANAVTTGTFTIPLMVRNGYPPTKAAAIEVAASTNGQLMPPIMGAAAFIIAEYCNLDYLQVVRAAVLPAFVSYMALLWITHIEACKLGLKGVAKEVLPAFGATFLRGVHYILPLAFLMWQLIIARRSANYAAYYAIMALMGVMIGQSIFLTRSLLAGLRLAIGEIFWGLVNGARNMVSIALAVSLAGICVGVVSLGLASQLTEVIGLLSGGRLLPLLCVTAGISLILGMGLPTTATYVVMANLTAPAMLTLAEAQGWELPLISAHLFCFYFGILADDTPPVGLTAFAAAAIAKSPPMETGLQGFFYDLRTAILPFCFIFNGSLLLLGVEGFFPIVGVFVAAILGMCACTSVLQGYCFAANKVWEAAALLVASAFLLLGSPWYWLPSAALLILVVWRQKLRIAM